MLMEQTSILGLDLDDAYKDRPSVLIVEDDPDTTFLLKQVLRHHDFNVLSAENGNIAIRKFMEHLPSIILLDLMMPEMDGWATLNHLRKISQVPVIILSAMVGREDIVRGFDEGVDDYIRKPFHNEEVVARIQAILRRRQTPRLLDKLVFPAIALLIDQVNQEVIFHNQKVELTNKEFGVLTTLAKSAPHVVTYAAISKEVWGSENEETFKRTKYLVYLIRKKLQSVKPKVEVIANIDRLGYRLNSAFNR